VEGRLAAADCRGVTLEGAEASAGNYSLEEIAKAKLIDKELGG
jgi:hypothetical protein